MFLGKVIVRAVDWVTKINRSLINSTMMWSQIRQKNLLCIVCEDNLRKILDFLIIHTFVSFFKNVPSWDTLFKASY